MVQNNDKLNSLRLYKSIISRRVEYAASFDSLLKRVSPPAIKTCQGDLAILVLAENKTYQDAIYAKCLQYLCFTNVSCSFGILNNNSINF